jgi:hypothetical protein
MHAKIEYTGAWMPFDARFDEDAGSRLATWVMDNWERDYDQHVIITPQTTNNSISEPPILAALADGAPWVSPRTDHENWGIPVVAAWPSEETLAYCVQRAHNTSLVVFEWANVPTVRGWATAVQAFNAETGEATPKLEPALHDVFVMLLFDDDYLREGAKRGRHRELTQGRLGQLRAAGLDQDFVVTYCIAMGYRGDIKRLREHCNEAGIPKKWMR